MAVDGLYREIHDLQSRIEDEVQQRSPEAPAMPRRVNGYE